MIKVLDKFIADKIAAGEVIERPVSAVKELVENSIDAGAKSIIVEIRGGGRNYIRVTDDGCGIPYDEAETAFLRHATSKISGIADLDNIRSLGFRGEALASIAAVSRLTMVSRTADSVSGIRLMLHGGQVISSERAGANQGTTIVVEDIFYNTPARRKFMGSDAREGSAVIDLIEQYAICYSDIRFMMIRNGETVFTTPGDGDTLAAIRSVYPDPAHSDLIRVASERVNGYVSDPLTVRNNRRGQLFFVNGRLVSSPVIEKGLEKGYGGRIFSGYPIALLFIEADPSEIDVNIHPGKREIRFLRAEQVIDDISSAVDAAMKTREAVPAYRPSSASAEDSADKPDKPDTYKYTPDPGMMVGEQSSIRDYLSSIVREPAAAMSPDVPAAGSRESAVSEKTGLTDSSEASKDDTTADTDLSLLLKPAERQLFDFADLTFKGYIFNTYIIMESKDTIYFFDQHAAHERINYEKFLRSYINSGQFPQPVLTPFTINVSADIYYIARDMLDPLRRMGYDIDDFGSGSFIVRGVPAYVTLKEAESFARTYIEEAGDSQDMAGLSRRDRNDAAVDKLIMKACKASVKGGERLSEKEISELIGELAGCSDPYACPHGRPTFIRYSRYEIERSFRRK